MVYSHDLIVSHLNGRRFDSIHHNMADVIANMVGTVLGPSTIIRAWVINDNSVKPNICIDIINQQYFLSVLSGNGNSVHEEKPDDILAYLHSLSAPTSVINCINDLCYSPYNTTEFINHELVNNAIRLRETREFFYNNRTAIIERALRTGIYTSIYNTQFVYWGDVECGYIRNINDVIRILSGYSCKTGLIAVGGLALQRKDRRVNNSIQLKWSRPNFDLRRR